MMRGFFLFLSIWFAAASAAGAGPTGAKRRWLAKYLRAGDKEARALLGKYPGGRITLKGVEALLAAGIPGEAMKSGMHHLTFRSGGETWKYTVSIPEGYDGKKRLPLLVDTGHISFKDATDEKAARALANYLRQVRAKVIGVRPRIFDKLGRDGRYGRMTRAGDGKVFSMAASLFRDILRNLRLRFAVDPDRVYLMGLSMSGYWTWRLGADLPGEVGGIIPISAVTHQVRFGYENFQGVPVFILHARDDAICKFRFAEEALKRLEELKSPVGHHFLKSGGHIAPFRHFSRGWQWMADRKRNTAPSSIDLHLHRSTLGSVHWIEMTDMKKGVCFQHDQAGASVTAEVQKGNLIEITTRNLKTLRVHLSPKLVDFQKPVKVKVNGRIVHNKRVKPDGKTALEEARKRCDTGIFYPANIQVRKIR